MSDDGTSNDTDATVIVTDDGTAIVSDTGEVTIEWSDGTVETYDSTDDIPTHTEN